MDFTLPYMRARYFTPAVAALLQARNLSEGLMLICAVGSGSLVTAEYFSSPAEPPAPFLVIGVVSVVCMFAALAIQWRAQQAFIATVEDQGVA